MKNVVSYYTSTLEFELPDANMAMGNGNPFELAVSSNYRDSNYRTDFQGRKCGLLRGKIICSN